MVSLLEGACDSISSSSDSAQPTAGGSSSIGTSRSSSAESGGSSAGSGSSRSKVAGAGSTIAFNAARRREDGLAPGEPAGVLSRPRPESRPPHPTPQSSSFAATFVPAAPVSVDTLTLRFSDPRVEFDYQRHQTCRFLAVDRVGLLVTTSLLLISWAVRGARPACYPALALTSLAFLANSLATLAMQACEAAGLHNQKPRLRSSYMAAVRLGYTAAAACFTSWCRSDEYRGCSPEPLRGRTFALDSGLTSLLYQAVVMPLPYREHLSVSAGSVALLVGLHNQGVCSAMTGTCYSVWFDSVGQCRVTRWLVETVVRLFSSSHRQHFGTLQACWVVMLFVQLVAGFLLPAAVIYLIEESARRRFLMGWRRRQQQQQQQQQHQR